MLLHNFYVYIIEINFEAHKMQSGVVEALVAVGVGGMGHGPSLDLPLLTILGIC